MRASDVELWALRVIDRVLGGHGTEDSRVELKREWPESANRAARQLAGHANAAGSDSILWIIGVDEKKAQIIGAEPKELANWLPYVQSEFEHITLAPILLHNVSVLHSRESPAATALLFDTARAPYVVKNAMYGTRGNRAEWEVPWREGNRTRSARHSDLIRILVPQAQLPRMTILNAQLSATVVGDEAEWRLGLDIYCETISDRLVVIPRHQCKVKVTIPGLGEHPSFTYIEFGQTRKSPMITHTDDELLISGPGAFLLETRVSTVAVRHDIPSSPAQIFCELIPSFAEHRITLETDLEYQGDSDTSMAPAVKHTWSFNTENTFNRVFHI